MLWDEKNLVVKFYFCILKKGEMVLTVNAHNEKRSFQENALKKHKLPCIKFVVLKLTLLFGIYMFVYILYVIYLCIKCIFYLSVAVAL